MGQHRNTKKVDVDLINRLMKEHGIVNREVLSTKTTVNITSIHKLLDSGFCSIKNIEKVANYFKRNWEELLLKPGGATTQIVKSTELNPEDVVARPQVPEFLPDSSAQSTTQIKTELLTQADAIGLNLLLSLPTGQSDPSGALASLSLFMSEAFDEYANYVRDSAHRPDLPGYAAFMRDDRRLAKLLKPLEGSPWDQIRVFFVFSFETVLKRDVYFYFMVPASLFDRAKEFLDKYQCIPEYAVIIGKGFDYPTDEVIADMKALYGFDHTKYENYSSPEVQRRRRNMLKRLDDEIS